MVNLTSRLDQFERLLREGAGRPPLVPPPVPPPAGSMTPAGTAVPMLTVLPDALLRAAPEMPEAPSKVDAAIRKLEALAKNTQALFVDELRNYREIALEDWPLPPGYQHRLAPAFLAEVYRQGRSAEAVGKEFVRTHCLDDCMVAQEIPSILASFDKMLTVDGEPGFINRVSTEYAARRAFGLQQAFRNCRKKDDWHKPKNAPQAWRSKVDWEELDRLDPRAAEALPAGMRDIQNEIRGELERDALMIKAKQRLREAAGADGLDRLNG